MNFDKQFLLKYDFYFDVTAHRDVCVYRYCGIVLINIWPLNEKITYTCLMCMTDMLVKQKKSSTSLVTK